MNTSRSAKVFALTLVAVGSIWNGCGQQASRDDSATKITGGSVVSHSRYPAIVHLTLSSQLGAATCTGTFVSDFQVLTAAHCVEGAKSVSAKISDGRTIKALKWSYNSDFDQSQSGDLAIVEFRKRSNTAMAALGEQPKAGDTFTILGFGNTTISDSYYVKVDAEENIVAKLWQHTGGDGRLRGGTNTIDEVAEGLISFEGDMGASNRNTGNAGSSTGDSGGPMFVEGKLVGVTSFGMPELGEAEEIRKDPDGTVYRLPVLKVKTSYIDLNSESSRKFLHPDSALINESMKVGH